MSGTDPATAGLAGFLALGACAVMAAGTMAAIDGAWPVAVFAFVIAAAIAFSAVVLVQSLWPLRRPPA